MAEEELDVFYQTALTKGKLDIVDMAGLGSGLVTQKMAIDEDENNLKKVI